MPTSVNGRRVNIQHDEENKRLFDLIHFRPDQINATGLSPRILLVVEGNRNLLFTYQLNTVEIMIKYYLGLEVERVGAPGGPVEGSNVTLICSTAFTSRFRPELQWESQKPNQSTNIEIYEGEHFLLIL